MENVKIEEIKAAADAVLNHYLNSITRKAFVQFVDQVICILSDE